MLRPLRQAQNSLDISPAGYVLEFLCLLEVRSDLDLVSKSHIRRYPRVGARIAVDCQTAEGTVRKHATILGGGGLYLEPDEPPLPSGPFTVKFRLAKNGPLIAAQAHVCYQDRGKGFGVEFQEIGESDRGLLIQCIQRKLGNRRKQMRAVLATQVQLGESMILAYSRDVSTGGIFVETEAPHAPGTSLTVRFSLDDTGPAVVASGEVTFSVARMGMGVRFTEITREDRQRIEAFVARNLPAPPVKSRPVRKEVGQSPAS